MTESFVDNTINNETRTIQNRQRLKRLLFTSAKTYEAVN